MTRRRMMLLLTVTAVVGSGLLIVNQRSQAAGIDRASDAAASVSLATDSAVYAPGNPVTITLGNHGKAPIRLERDPAFQIRQRDTVIYEPVAALGINNQPARTIASGESFSWVWDGYALSGQVPPGIYQIALPYQTTIGAQMIRSEITIESK